MPSVVCEPEVVGPDEVLQHTPLAVTSALQSPEIVPPEEADIVVIEDTDVVVIDGSTAPVVKERSAP